MKRVCLNCGTPIYGRSDKKFCSHNCRAYYNNIIYKEKRDSARNNSKICYITEYLTLMHNIKRNYPIKIIFFITKLCKIISNFETSNKRKNKIK